MQSGSCLSRRCRTPGPTAGNSRWDAAGCSDLAWSARRVCCGSARREHRVLADVDVRHGRFPTALRTAVAARQLLSRSRWSTVRTATRAGRSRRASSARRRSSTAPGCTTPSPTPPRQCSPSTPGRDTSTKFTAAYLIGAIYTDSGILAGIGGCGALATDDLFARYVPVWAYEFDARNGPGAHTDSRATSGVPGTLRSSRTCSRVSTTGRRSRRPSTPASGSSRAT